MRLSRRLASACALAGILAGAAPASAVVGEPTSWFVPAATPYGVLGHADGSIWVATASGVLRYSRAGEPLGAVTAAACASLARGANGDVVLVDHCGRAIERRAPDGALLRRWAIADAARDGGRVVCDRADNVYVLFDRTGDGSGPVRTVVRKYDPDGAVLAESAPLDAATGLACTGGRLYVAEAPGGRVRRLGLDLVEQGSFTLRAGLANDLQSDRDGNLLFTDRTSTSVRRLSPEGQLLEVVSDERPDWPAADAGWAPWGVSEAPDGLFIVSENSAGRVLLFGEPVVRERRRVRGSVPADAL
ncbi:MAG: hypothetical protein U0704_11460 [Candidatus Eisenbacteria bacterium]